MGEKLMEYYEYMNERDGLKGKMELAKATNLPSTKASTAEDSEENVQLLREAIQEITGERPPRL